MPDPAGDSQIVVNGRPSVVTSGPSATLLRVLREELGLGGTKEACGRGECGSCTVLLGEEPVMSCTVLAALVDAPVTTIEGIAESAADLRAAFADSGAFQCGFCTPGQVVRAEALLRRGRPLDDRTVRTELAGNICRCTGYGPIVDAVLATGRARRDLG